MFKLTSHDTFNIGILPSASKVVSINSAEQFLKIITNNDQFSGLKVSTKITKI